MPPKAPSDSPLIGIWWDDGQTLAALAHSPGERSSIIAGYFDSDLEHGREWKQVAAQFGKSPQEEYFTVPRGRVVLSKRTGESVIYHGSATTPERLQAIAGKFQLITWKSGIDVHYETGAAADLLFEDEER